jgi:hypothetical protein
MNDSLQGKVALVNWTIEELVKKLSKTIFLP